MRGVLLETSGFYGLGHSGRNFSAGRAIFDFDLFRALTSQHPGILEFNRGIGVSFNGHFIRHRAQLDEKLDLTQKENHS